MHDTIRFSPFLQSPIHHLENRPVSGQNKCYIETYRRTDEREISRCCASPAGKKVEERTPTEDTLTALPPPGGAPAPRQSSTLHTKNAAKFGLHSSPLARSPAILPAYYNPKAGCCMTSPNATSMAFHSASRYRAVAAAAAAACVPAIALWLPGLLLYLPAQNLHHFRAPPDALQRQR